MHTYVHIFKPMHCRGDFIDIGVHDFYSEYLPGGPLDCYENLEILAVRVKTGVTDLFITCHGTPCVRLTLSAY